jgi:myo-inositol-1(or 4)-monophosphatase
MDTSQELLAFLNTLADAAGPQILPHFRVGTKIENKEKKTGFDPVTQADKAAERAIRALIEASYPSHGIRGEEYGNKPANSSYTWVIDPIDGTRAFVSGLPVWGVLIGLLKDGVPVLGLMDQPFTGERFIGGPQGAKWVRNDVCRSMQVRKCTDLGHATLCTTDANLFVGEECGVFETLRTQTRLQRFGLDCYAYGALALGCVDLVVESGLKDFDICGLIPVVEAAGGQVTNWCGQSAAKGGQIIASGDPELHAQVLQILAPAAH